MNNHRDEEINILIVDDNPGKRSALETVVSGLGFRVLTAASGQEALHLLLAHDFAVILLDVNMPIMDGFETASIIHGRPRSEHTPIIFVTAISTTDDERFRGYRLGAVDYVFSPVMPEVLRAKVAVFADLYRLRRGAVRQVEQLATMNEQLRKEVAARYQAEEALTRSNADLLVANRELEAFSYSVSHDLRAPLRAIDGFSRKVITHYGDQLDDEGRRLLQVVRDNAQRMGQLIDDLLAFSRMGRREMELRPVDMEAMVKGVVEELRAVEPQRVIEFALAPLPRARGDAAMLRQVWLNLLGNAVKFSRQRPVANIEIGGRAAGGELLYWVKDNGAGFDQQYADKLFGVFQRLHRQDEFEGTGVGLAITQRILHRHHGRIRGEGQPDAGATFQFTLPLPALDDPRPEGETS